MTQEILQKPSKTPRNVTVFLIASILLNIVFWMSVRDVQAYWSSVPPVPSEKHVKALGLGDASLAYRSNGIMIQNFGDTGGRSTSLKEYDFDTLTKWFFLQDRLDQKSNYTPYLAAYYFGAVQEPEKFRPVLEYLKQVGMRTDHKKWRWLAQAVYIARFRMNDYDKALDLAHVLASIDYDDAPLWVKQMPAFVMNAKGSKKEAYALMLEILKTNAETMHPSEVNATKAYVCEQILSKEEARQNDLCNDYK